LLTSNKFNYLCVALQGGTNKYGYMLTCILCVDDHMNGVPGAFMISSSESAETVALFVRTVEDAVNEDIRGENCCLLVTYR
jgi:hypothetical protein